MTINKIKNLKLTLKKKNREKEQSTKVCQTKNQCCLMRLENIKFPAVKRQK